MSAPATMPAERGTAPVRGAWLREVWRSSVGKKIIVAITGLVLVLYVIGHMLGNLKAFQGAGGSEGAAIDHYAEWIRGVGEPVIPHGGVLWTLRALVLACFLVHVVGTVQLAFGRNRTARPDGYSAPRIGRTFAAMTMIWGGLFILAFVVFHILHFTTGTIDPGSFTEGAVYQNLREAFDSPFLLAIYVAASAILAYHLYHAVWSSLQTMGWDKPNRNPTFRRLSVFTAIAVGVGFAVMPIAFFTGILE